MHLKGLCLQTEEEENHICIWTPLSDILSIIMHLGGEFFDVEKNTKNSNNKKNLKHINSRKDLDHTTPLPVMLLPHPTI